MTDSPLIVTLRLDDPTRTRFEVERAELFPPGRTSVGAHVTLFHALPVELHTDVEDQLAGVPGPLEVAVVEVRSLGRGVAYGLSCPALQTCHDRWRRRWRAHLTRQDAQPLRLHVTVQNKVAPEVARSTLTELRRDFSPWTAHGEALELWRYVGGPWEALRSFPLLG